MNLLFIHANYPAQFRNLAFAAGQRKKGNVVFLTKEDYPNKWPMEGVEVVTYKLPRAVRQDAHHYLKPTELAVLTGQAVTRALHDLMRGGFKPDVIIYHAGNGLGLFVKDLFPNAKCIGYFEWYFTPSTSRYLLPKFSFDLQLATNLRNLPILSELSSCDVAVVPTEWQKSQFPMEFHGKLQVIFDGIDLTFFSPDLSVRQQVLELPGFESGATAILEPQDLVLTYATRGMEPLRGFPQFMRMLPRLLGSFPELKVVIAGQDRAAYSYRSPGHGGSWKNTLMDELAGRGDVDLARIHFTGLLNYPRYRQLLQRSDLHCSFTRPYVMSWSVVEAAACAAPLALAEGPATAMMQSRSRCQIDLNGDPEQEARKLEGILAERLEERKQEALSGCSMGWVPMPDSLSIPHSLRAWQRLLIS
ncbi:MAG: glycosyl transferase family 1 [Cyanobium sp. CZS 48M]|nr:glycosyl transferase family 1 [Cyanobium sp. CZS48M]